MSVVSDRSSVVSSVDVLNDAKEDVYLAQDGSATSPSAAAQRSDAIDDRLSSSLSTISRDGAGTANTIRSSSSQQPHVHYMAVDQLRNLLSTSIPSRSQKGGEGGGRRSASCHRPLFPPSRTSEGTLGAPSGELLTPEPSWTPAAVPLSSVSSFQRHRTSTRYHYNSIWGDDSTRMAESIDHAHSGRGLALTQQLLDAVRSITSLGDKERPALLVEEGKTVSATALMPAAKQAIEKNSLAVPLYFEGAATATLDTPCYAEQALLEVSLARRRITQENERLFGPAEGTAEAREQLRSRDAIEREISGFLTRSGSQHCGERSLSISASSGMISIRPLYQVVPVNVSVTREQLPAQPAQPLRDQAQARLGEKDRDGEQRRLRDVSREALARLERLRIKVNASLL